MVQSPSQDLRSDLRWYTDGLTITIPWPVSAMVEKMLSRLSKPAHTFSGCAKYQKLFKFLFIIYLFLEFNLIDTHYYNGLQKPHGMAASARDELDQDRPAGNR